MDHRFRSPIPPAARNIPRKVATIGGDPRWRARMLNAFRRDLVNTVRAAFPLHLPRFVSSPDWRALYMFVSEWLEVRWALPSRAFHAKIEALREMQEAIKAVVSDLDSTGVHPVGYGFLYNIFDSYDKLVPICGSHVSVPLKSVSHIVGSIRGRGGAETPRAEARAHA